MSSLELKVTLLKNGEVNDSDGQYLQIAASLKNLDYLYIDRSSAYVPAFHENFTCYGKFSKQLENDGITNPEINKE